MIDAPVQSVRLAVIDDDSGFVSVLLRRARAAGWEVRHSTAAIPPEELASMKLNALVIDPAALGDEADPYLERICSMLGGLGVIVCTGSSSVARRVRGLRSGLDDWVTKPCHPEEVMARVEAVSRRHRRDRGEADAAPLLAGEVEIRPDQFQAFVGGESVGLTRREFELLRLLAGAGGRVLERESIYSSVWGYSMPRGDRSVDVFVRKLRLKLAHRSPGWTYIHTHFGIGYRFHPECAVDEKAGRASEPPEVGSQLFHKPATDA